MKPAIRSFFFLLVLLVAQPLSAQKFNEKDLVFRHLTVEDGLSQGNVNCFAQDSKGYLWIGTQDGLNRYDGYTFKYFRHDHLDSASISSSYVMGIAACKNNSLLVATDDGLDLFETPTEKFFSFKHDDKNKKSIPGDKVSSICQINDSIYCGGVWEAGIFLFNIETREFSSFQHNVDDSNSLGHDHVNILKQGTDGKVYIGTRAGFSIFNIKTKRFKNFYAKNNCTNCISSGDVQSIYEDGNKVWLGSFDGVLNCFDKSTETFRQFEISHQTIIDDIIRITDSTLLIGTIGRGLFFFNERNGAIQNMLNDPFNKNSINNNIIYNFFKGADNILWIGTGGGLDYYHTNFGFTDLDQKFIKNTLNHHQNNYSIYKDKEGIIWSGSVDQGLRAYNTNDGSVIHFKYNPKNKNTINSDGIISIFEDDESNMWIGNYDKGLNCINRKTGKIISFYSDTGRSGSTYALSFNSIMQAHDKRLWMGTDVGGIYLFNKSTQQFNSYRKKDVDDHTSINNDYIYCIKEDKQGNMLICTDGGGLNILNIRTKKFDYFINDPADKNSISNNEVYCVYEDQQGLLWLGTSSGGLNVFDRKKNIFHCFTEKDGLPNNDIYGILADENGSLWMSTIKGICKFSYSKNLDIKKLNERDYMLSNIVIQNFNHNDGLIADEFNQGAYFKSDDGIFYFGSVKGIVSFRPSDISSNKFNAPTVVSRIKNFKNEIAYYNSSQIILDYKNYLTVEFTSLSYLAPEKNKYAFMFEGRDTSWNDLRTTRTVSFLDLKPGEYTLKIRSSNNDGVWGTNPAEVKIKVNPPFYETWWFRISILVAVAVAVAVTFRTRVNRIRKVEEQKTAFNKSLSEVEMKALRSQMNPHFIFNSLHSINKYMLDNDKQNASEFLSKFSKLMRLILENSREQEVPLENDLHALELYMQLEALRFQNKFQYKIEVDDELDKENTLIPPMILQPFVENSIVHGMRAKENGLIQIKIEKEGEMIKCSVEDNGSGRQEKAKVETGEEKAEEKKHKSLAMKITQERLNIISQLKKVKATVNIIDLKDADNKPCGLLVELLLPYETAF